jgi:hypothetical protein
VECVLQTGGVGQTAAGESQDRSGMVCGPPLLQFPYPVSVWCLPESYYYYKNTHAVVPPKKKGPFYVHATIIILYHIIEVYNIVMAPAVRDCVVCVARRPTGIPQEDSVTAELAEASHHTLPEFQTRRTQVSHTFPSDLFLGETETVVHTSFKTHSE